MIPFSINGKPIQIPSSWNELTLRQFFAVRKADSFFDKMEVITGEKDWDKVQDIDVTLLPFMLWLTDEKEFEDSESQNWLMIQGQYRKLSYEIKKDLGEYSFGQKIMCQRELARLQSEEKSPFDAIPLLIATYFQSEVEGVKYDPEAAEKFIEKVLEMNIRDIYPAYKFITQELLRLIQRDQIHLTRTPSQAEALVGTKELDPLKDLILIDSLAGGDIFKHDAVTELPYNRVFGKLYMQNEIAKHQEKIESVMKQKQKV